MHIDMVKTISYMDVIKECIINIDLPVVSMGYAHKQLGDNHGIAWSMPFALMTVCGESTAHRWILSQTINSAELCCLITAFCIVGGALMLDLRFPHCWPSVQCLHWK